MRHPKTRYSALRSRLALVIVGLALGFVARWIGSLLQDQGREPVFQPLPAEISGDPPTETQSTAE